MCRSKHFSFRKPVFTVAAEDAGDRFLLSVSADTFARSVRLTSSVSDVVFSDNYLDMTDGTIFHITVEKDELPAGMTPQAFADSLTLVSVYDLG